MSKGKEPKIALDARKKKEKEKQHHSCFYNTCMSVNLKDLPIVRVHVLTCYKMNVPMGQICILVITM